MPNTPEHEDFTGYGLIPLADQVLSFFGLTHHSTEYDALDDAEQALFDNLFPFSGQRRIHDIISKLSLEKKYHR